MPALDPKLEKMCEFYEALRLSFSPSPPPTKPIKVLVKGRLKEKVD